MDRVNAILDSLESTFTTLLPAWEAFAFVYAWAAIFSILLALLGIVMVVFRRTDGLGVVTLIGQAVGVVAIPMMLAEFL